MYTPSAFYERNVRIMSHYPDVQEFLDVMCESFPLLMEQMLDQQFGDMKDWFSGHEGPDYKPTSGCLIGSAALMMSGVLTCATTDHWGNYGPYLLTEFLIKCGYFTGPLATESGGYSYTTIQRVPEKTKQFYLLAERAGWEAPDIQDNYRQRGAEHIMKDYIYSRLQRAEPNEQEWIMLFTHAK